MLTRRRFLQAAGACIPVGLGLYGWRIEPHWLEIVRRPLLISGLPAALAGRTLVQPVKAPRGAKHGSAFAVVITPLAGSGPVYAARVETQGENSVVSIIPAVSALTTISLRPVRDSYDAVAPDPAHFEEFAGRVTAMVHELPGWTDELRSLQAPTLLIFGDRDFSSLSDVAELADLLPGPQVAVLPGTTHIGVVRRPAEVLGLITRFLDGR